MSSHGPDHLVVQRIMTLSQHLWGVSSTYPRGMTHPQTPLLTPAIPPPSTIIADIIHAMYAHQPASLADTAARRSRGILMYTKYVLLFHLPSIWIMESSTPSAAVGVAAPILKLWPA